MAVMSRASESDGRREAAVLLNAGAARPRMLGLARQQAVNSPAASTATPTRPADA